MACRLNNEVVPIYTVSDLAMKGDVTSANEIDVRGVTIWLNLKSQTAAKVLR
jgi:hypothetical protein